MKTKKTACVLQRSSRKTALWDGGLCNSTASSSPRHAEGCRSRSTQREGRDASRLHWHRGPDRRQSVRFRRLVRPPPARGRHPLDTPIRTVSLEARSPSSSLREASTKPWKPRPIHCFRRRALRRAESHHIDRVVVKNECMPGVPHDLEPEAPCDAAYKLGRQGVADVQYGKALG